VTEDAAAAVAAAVALAATKEKELTSCQVQRFGRASLLRTLRLGLALC
jgi:hypothetical protein